MRTYVVCKTEVPCLCSRSQPGVRGEFKGPPGAFVSYCNISWYFLWKKIRLDVSCESSASQRIHMKYQVLFSRKNKEKMFKETSSLEEQTPFWKSLMYREANKKLQSYFPFVRMGKIM